MMFPGRTRGRKKGCTEVGKPKAEQPIKRKVKKKKPRVFSDLTFPNGTAISFDEGGFDADEIGFF